MNKIGNDIMANSVVSAIKEATDCVYYDNIYTDKNEKLFDEYFATPIYEKMGKTIYDDLYRYRTLKPHKFRLRDVAKIGDSEIN